MLVLSIDGEEYWTEPEDRDGQIDFGIFNLLRGYKDRFTDQKTYITITLKGNSINNIYMGYRHG